MVKILNIEDDIFKHNDIRKALERCGSYVVDLCDNMEDGLKCIEQAIDKGEPYGLIITDMHYPLSKGAAADVNAGVRFINELKKRKINVPVIVCSSIRLTIPEAVGCVWYNPSRDLDDDFKELLEKIF